MTKPGSRQFIAQLIAQHLAAQLYLQPLPPLASPCLPGFLTRKQAT
jgi:hypothetical protein